jgi:hypothetical protein
MGASCSAVTGAATKKFFCRIKKRYSYFGHGDRANKQGNLCQRWAGLPRHAGSGEL